MLMASIMVVLAVILLVLGIKQYLEAKRFVSRIDSEVGGFVTDVQEEESQKNGTIYRMIYAADINGESVEFRDRYYRKRRKNIGTPVIIRFEEGNYNNFAADKIDQRYQIPFTFMGMAVVFIILAIITYIRFP